jgi:hypothetical protein
MFADAARQLGATSRGSAAMRQPAANAAQNTAFSEERTTGAQETVARTVAQARQTIGVPLNHAGFPSWLKRVPKPRAQIRLLPGHLGWHAGRYALQTGMRKDVREFIRRLEAVGLTVEATPGHYRVLRDGKPLRKANGMPFMLPFSPDTIRWRKAAIVELRKLGIDV